LRHIILLLVGLTLVGCQTAYYKTWEKLGWEKRDILVDRVQDAKEEQEAAKEQFKTTLERFQELTSFSGGQLEAKYKQLGKEYDRCKDRAEELSDRIKAVNTVATDMFKEWRAELKQYEDDRLRRSSEEKLQQTEERYQQLYAAMKKSEASMQPVLRAFHDQVLYLKHNLNAQAISSLQGTAAEIEEDVQKLIAEMEASIAEANAFISQMKS
jgi:uncharacterized protein (DUF885 family)